MRQTDLPSKVPVKKWLKQLALVTPGDRPSKVGEQNKVTKCPTVETVCRRFMRQARRGGHNDIRKAQHLICEPNYVVKAFTTPTDTFFNLQWGLHQTSDIDIDAPEAWDISQGSNSVIVGVIDTGIQTNHPDLSTNIWTNPGEIGGNGIDDDGNGYIDDVHGVNTITSSGTLTDDNGHGSHCAGVIGASTNNGTGVSGINWNVKLIGCKFLPSSGSGTTADAIQCLQYFTDLKTNRGVDVSVLSNSWGSSGNSSSLRAAFQASADAGIISVAAAGNDAIDNDGATKNYPASFPDNHIISVAAIDSDGFLATFSNYGATSVDIGAPGVQIASTGYTSNYIYLSGTSMATPHVAGALALLKANYPAFSISDARDAVLQSSVPLSSLTGKVATGGMLNIYSMLLSAAVMSTTTTTTSTTTTTTVTTTTTESPPSSSSSTVTSTSEVPTTSPVTSTTVTPSTSTTRLNMSDAFAPTVKALKATGTARKSVKTSYLVRDNSGFTIDTIRIKKGARVLQSYSLGLRPIPANSKRQQAIRVRKLGRGNYNFCVTARDMTLNKSAESCASLKLN